MPIYQLFPEPVYFSNIERAWTKKELKLIKGHKNKASFKNKGNTVSDDTYVLNHPTLKNLKKDLYKKVIDYFNEIVCTGNSITPYITQSWLNYTETDQYHHRHSHPNSYLSGVFYINADKKVDKIRFYKLGTATGSGGPWPLQLNIKKFNVFNARSWWYTVQSGDLVLFPSSLIHGVDTKEGDNTRISLAFNVFLKGHVGNPKNLTELILT